MSSQEITIPQSSATLHLVCGKVASGKSTLTKKLSEAPGTIIIAEDDWLAALYADEMTSIADFVRCSAKLRNIMGQHITTLLNEGVSVVLDIQANTIESRTWMKGIIRATGVAHKLHYLEVSDEVCKVRLRARNASGDHPFSVTEVQFEQLAKYFVSPSPEEGFNIVLHNQNETQ